MDLLEKLLMYGRDIRSISCIKNGFYSHFARICGLFHYLTMLFKAVYKSLRICRKRSKALLLKFASWHLKQLKMVWKYFINSSVPDIWSPFSCVIIEG